MHELSVIVISFLYMELVWKKVHLWQLMKRELLKFLVIVKLKGKMLTFCKPTVQHLNKFNLIYH